MKIGTQVTGKRKDHTPFSGKLVKKVQRANGEWAQVKLDGAAKGDKPYECRISQLTAA